MLPDAVARARKIKLIAFDVDGVMTDGTLYLADDGQEYKGFNSLDGRGDLVARKLAALSWLCSLRHFDL